MPYGLPNPRTDEQATVLGYLESRRVELCEYSTHTLSRDVRLDEINQMIAWYKARIAEENGS